MRDLFGCPLVGELLRLRSLFWRHPVSRIVSVSIPVFIAMGGREVEPHMRLRIILRHAKAVEIQHTQVVQGRGVPLLGR